MKFFTPEQASRLYWFILVSRFCSQTIGSLALAWTISAANIEFGSLTLWTKIAFVMGIVAVWADKMNMFFDQIMSRLAKGELPSEDNKPKP